MGSLLTVAHRRLGAAMAVAAFLSGCIRFSVMQEDPSVGFNGGFEVARAGLPVNWFFPRIKDKGDVEISLDTLDAVEGRQSLKLVVRKVDSVRGGWAMPGLFQVRPARPGSTYRISFWRRNRGCRIRVTIRNEGKDPLFGPSDAVKKDLAAHPRIVVVLAEEETGTRTWRQFDQAFALPQLDDHIRFELHIMEPGTLWVDDIQIQEAPL
jgi:hypothetical protein|tara:strand:- start:15712 stop:16338 length:627 start_codon:yes stop_codon:yes gene_type:complete